MEKGVRVFDREGQVQEQGSERGESRKQLKKVGTRGKIMYADIVFSDTEEAEVFLLSCVS